MEFDEAYLFPFECMELQPERVLVIAPHPDDETYGCGGTICRYKELGSEVHVVVLTDGVMGDSRKRYDPKEYVRLRENEVRKALEHLGIESCEFWRYPDRELHEYPELGERIASLIKEYRPTLIFSASPLDIHPDHRHTAQTVYEAIQKVPENANIRLAFYEVVVPFRPTHLVDLSSVYPRKRAAMESFATQQEELDYVSKIVAFNHFRSFTLPPSVEYVEAFWILSPAQGGALSFEHLRNATYFKVDRSKETPLVSLIIRTRNRLQWLREALTSVQAQTYSPVEVIVVNDGGDDIAHILKPFRKSFSIREVNHPQSRGRAAAANAGLSLATGKYLNFLDDDDLIYPHHLSTLIRYAQETGARAIYSDCDVVRYEWNGREHVQMDRQGFRRSGPVDWSTLLFENQLPSMTVLFERDLLHEIGEFDETLDIYEDWDFWIRLSARTNLRHLPDTTAEYRQMGEQGVGVGGRTYNFWDWSARIWEKHWDGITPERLRQYQEKIIGTRIQEVKRKSEEEKSKLRHELNLQQQATARIQHEYNLLGQEHSRFAQEHDKLCREHIRLGQEHQQMVQGYQDFAKNHDELCHKHNQLGQEHAKRMQEYEKLIREFNQIHQEHNQLKEEHGRMCEENAQLREDNTRLHEENIRFHEENTRFHEENSRLHEERNHFEAQANALESHLESIHTSTSWKLTAPYRSLGGLFKKD